MSDAPQAIDTAPPPDMNSARTAKIVTKNVNVFYDDKQALKDVNLDIYQNEVTALIGPSGCGKSTYLRCLNRMNDVIDICHVSGEIVLDGRDVYRSGLDVVQLRAHVGMAMHRHDSGRAPPPPQAAPGFPGAATGSPPRVASSQVASYE